MNPSHVHFFLHVPTTASIAHDTAPAVDHILLTVDTPNAELTMRLPIGRRKHAAPGVPRAFWDRWIARLHASFVEKFHTSVFDRDILLNIACLYRAFTIGRRIRVHSDFYEGFTFGLLDIARATPGRCIKRDLALYVIDMRVLVPDPALDEAPLSFLRHYYPKPATPDFPDGDSSPDTTFPPPSPSISAAAELAEASMDDSGYESSDTMPSLRTISDSSDDDEVYSDSSEDPDSDDEEETLVAQGFVVDESDSDLDL